MPPKILIADDDALIRKLLQDVLRRDNHYELLQASDGEQALDIAQRMHPTLAFLDVLMPKMDGFLVCSAIKRSPETAAIKVVMVTALAQPHEERRAYAMGADGFVTKPFSPETLLRIVDEVLEIPSSL